jgi:ribosomal-protein-alanine N-acetyltransferase
VPHRFILARMSKTLETARLLLSEWSENNVALLARLSGDARVVRYIGTGERWSPETAAEVSRAALEHWQAQGFGWRVALERRSAEPVGFAALNFVGEGTSGLGAREVEIGWWLLPSAWGRGFASEAARAMCEEAFTRLGVPSIVARLQPENVASARVAKRIGMTHEFETTGRHGEDVAVYRLLASDWAASKVTR